MFDRGSVAGDWPALVARLDAAHTLERWASAEPVLAGRGSVADLARPLGPVPGRPPVGSAAHGQPGPATGSARVGAGDEVLGALVRLGAADGGDDPDAVLMVLHLLSREVSALAARWRDRSADPLSLVVGELAAQVRAYPWRRRQRAYAANLLRDTNAATRRELLPGWSRGRPGPSVVLVDPTDPTAWARVLDGRASRAAPAPEQDGAAELAELMVWARAHGVASEPELALLVECELIRGGGAGAWAQVALRHGADPRTLRRRRARTLRSLQAAARDYVSDLG